MIILTHETTNYKLNRDYSFKGCQKPPAKTSRYCIDHDHKTMVFRNDDEDSSSQAPSTAEIIPGSLIAKITNQ